MWCKIFFGHTDLVKLLNLFHIVSMMDGTYKTNRYRLPLLEIVGVTSTGLIFSMTYILVEVEHGNNII